MKPHWAIWGAMALLSANSHAQTVATAQLENLDRLEKRVTDFTARDGMARAPRIDRRLRLSTCDVAPELLWYGTGQTTVLVRCGGAKSWQIYVPVPIVRNSAERAVTGGNGVVVVTRPVMRGAALTAADVKIAPSTTISGGATAVDQVVGKIAVRALNPGEPVRATLIAAAPMVRRGDPVQIKTGGAGIEIAVKGIAEEDGPAGGRVRVRNVASGSRLQVIVVEPGIVALPGYKNPEPGRE